MAETCIGCGVSTEAARPFAAIVGDDGRVVAKPCCAACHEDPAHRTTPFDGPTVQRRDAGYGIQWVTSQKKKLIGDG